MSATLIGYARCSTDAQNLMSRPTLCPLTSRISHIRPIFGKYFGNPLVSCTDDHAMQTHARDRRHASRHESAVV
jgi:hypothetical protein